MAGLDKIINQILEEADNSAKEKRAAAESRADQTMQDAKEEAAKAGKEISRRSEMSVQNYQERIKSANDLARRTALLEAKQKLISDVIEKAYQQFCAREGEEYWQTIREMVGRFALAQEGDIYFSSRDLERMPSGFAEEIDEIAQTKGGRLNLSTKTRPLNGGFVLAYGGIEENCSFKALFDSKEDEFKDQVQQILFS